MGDLVGGKRRGDGLLRVCAALTMVGGALFALPFVVIALRPHADGIEDGLALIFVYELSLYLLVAAAVCWAVWLAYRFRRRY